MKEVRWSEFRAHGFGTFARHGVKELKLVDGRGKRWINMYIHDNKDDMTREGYVLIDKAGKKFKECILCGSMYRVRYIVPYDGAATPGAYCWRCRRKRSLMDIKDAKRYGKIL
jgi:hypothetical protein